MTIADKASARACALLITLNIIKKNWTCTTFTIIIIYIPTREARITAAKLKLPFSGKI